FGISLGSIAEQLPQQYPFVEKSSLLYTLGEINIEVKQQRFKQFEAAYVDYSFLDVFDFEGYRGQFKAPHQVVLSRQAAMRIFPGINPLGQTLTYQDKKFEVVEIIDVSPSTRFQFDILLPIEALADGEELIQGGFEFEVFAVLAASQNNNASLKVLANSYDQLVERVFTEYQSSSYWIPLKEVYFHEVHNQMGNGSKPLLWLVAAIAVIILLLALINYFNLQMASDHTRQTEIRIRRIMGAHKKDLIYQSLLTSMLQVVISGGLALVLVVLFYKIEGKQLFGAALLSLTDWPLLYWYIYISFLLVLGALAGLAPALQLFKIGYSHQSSLKGLKLGKATIGLVVGQFFVTACLLSAVFLIQAQMRLIQEQPKGFNDEQVVVVRSLGEDFIQVYATLKNTLLAHPTIKTVAGAQGEPGGGVSGQSIRKLGDPIE
ncbi:MAG: ABC transporter permease, partial [Bacteroidota bacterium]